MKKQNDSEWDLPISKEEWEEIMAEQELEETLAYYANIEAILAEEAEYEEEMRRHAGGLPGINDIDYEPEDPENVAPDYGYASYFA